MSSARSHLILILLAASVAACAQAGPKEPLAGNGAPSRSLRLNSYGIWHLTGPEDHQVGSMVDAAIKRLARRDVVCFTEHMEPPPCDLAGMPGVGPLTPQLLRSLNPQARVYRTYVLTGKVNWDSDFQSPDDTSRMQTPMPKKLLEKNDWWLRDGNGQMVIEGNGSFYRLDVGKPGFKEAYLAEVLRRIEGKGFDGVVFDCWTRDISGWLKGRPMPKEYPTDRDWFEKAWKPFITYVCDGLHGRGYRVIGNCVVQRVTPEQQFERSKIDGAIYEQGAVGWSGEWLAGSVIEERIRDIQTDTLEAWVEDGGLYTDDPAYSQKQLVSLAMYYTAIPMKESRHSYGYHGKGAVLWDPLWDLDIGAPAELPAKRAEKYFWSRKFTKGIVVLNYEASESMSYALDQTYRDPEGKAVSGTVTLPPHTGMILATRS